ncbi:MAG: hypothetical protein ACLQNE_23725 [Thermoguttaceae bacterium]
MLAKSLWTAVACLVGLVCGSTLVVAEEAAILGSPRDVATVADFGPEAAKLWESRAGDNVKWNVLSGYSIPGVAQTLLRIEGRLKNPADREPSHNWFASAWKSVPSGLIPQDADGIRVTCGSLTSGQWWVALNLTTSDGQRYSTVVADQPFPPGQLASFLVPLGKFKNKAGQALRSSRAKDIREIGLGLGGLSDKPRVFLLDRISAYRQPRQESWIEFSTSHAKNNLYYRDEPVELSFVARGKTIPDARKIAYLVRDDEGKIVASRSLALSNTSPQAVRLPSPRDGYYQVSAFFADVAGKPLTAESAIRTEGTVPLGLGTFAIMPHTQQESIQRRKRLGQDAFFGIHGDFHGIGDYVGVSWRLEYSAWQYIEPQKPDRSKGDPQWIAERLKEPARPDYCFEFLPFVFNLRNGLPKWAQNPGDRAPAFKRWDDAMALVRDQVRVNKHLYPHMKPRIYGGAWEVNLNMPPYISQQPEYKPEDVVELFRRVREVVKSEDPEALMAGPNPSTLDLPWYERIFKAGVLPYLDAIETHAYDDGVFTPEENDTAGKLLNLHELVRKYNRGKPLPIYVTERGVMGSGTSTREQAAIMTRSCIIAKGSGVRVFMPFFGIDYDLLGFGFCFNREMDRPGGPWATQRISPKPMMNAVATCARLLEGTHSRERILGLGEGVWAYAFENDQQQITAVWTTGTPRTLALPLGGSQEVQIVSMMGRTRSIQPRQGGVDLEISISPIYLIQPKR